MKAEGVRYFRPHKPPVAARDQVACFVCGQSFFRRGDTLEAFSLLFNGKIVENHVLARCQHCGMVQALLVDEEGLQPPALADYSEYGDYLVAETEEEIRKRIDDHAYRWRRMFERLAQRFARAAVLDFGSGAGYFPQAAAEFGFETFGVEVSSKMREYSRDRVGFPSVYPSLEALGERQFDAVFAAEVIEHLHPSCSRNLMTSLLAHLRPGGLFVGSTPNIGSLNVRLFRDKEYVIYPPWHVCYFSTRTLDHYLRSLGLERDSVTTRELNPLSFLRPSKFELSFVEKPPKGWEWIVPPVHLAFRLAGLPVRWCGLGHEIYFAYLKPSRSNASPARDE